MRHMTTLTVREARERCKPPMTQEDLESKSKVDQSYISLIERGLRVPSDDIKHRLAKALGVAPSRLRFTDPQPDATVDPARDGEGHGVPVGGRS